MFKNKFVYIFLAILNTSVLFAGGNGSAPGGTGVFATIALGVRALLGRGGSGGDGQDPRRPGAGGKDRGRIVQKRARQSFAEQALEFLNRIQTRLDELRNASDRDAALARVRQAHQEYFEFVRQFGVTDEQPGPQEASRLLAEAERAVVPATSMHDFQGHDAEPLVTPARRLEGPNGMSPTAARLSSGLEPVLEHVPQPLLGDVQQLMERLRNVPEETARRVARQIEQLSQRLGATEEVAQEVMTLRGAVQGILKILQKPVGSALPNLPAPPPIVSGGHDPFA